MRFDRAIKFDVQRFCNEKFETVWFFVIESFKENWNEAGRGVKALSRPWESSLCIFDIHLSKGNSIS